MSERKQSGHVTETPDASYIKNIDVAHETSDVQIGSIAKFVVALLILTIATHIALWGMFLVLNASEAKKEVPRSPMALTGADRLPPEPRLQGAPGFSESIERTAVKHETEEKATAPEGSNRPKEPMWEIKALRKQWNDVLEQGPVDQNGKRYGMPINRAKEEALKQLPVRKQ